MEKNLQIWMQKTNAIWLGVMLFGIGGVISISTTGNLAPLLVGKGVYGFIMFLALTCIIVGYALYIMAIKSFREILESDDYNAVGKVYIGAILVAIAYVWLFLGFWEWVSTALRIIAFLFMLMGYMQLKNSPTFPVKARKGASNLFMAMILALIGCVLTFLIWIPVLGYVIVAIASIFTLVSYVLIFIGWAQIKNADPDQLQ